MTVFSFSAYEGFQPGHRSAVRDFSDFARSPNQAQDPELYELENQAFDRSGLVLAAMRELAPWAGQTLLDLGCGSGYWLPGYAAEAAVVIGVEPDPTLLPLAADRCPEVRVLPGSAEHIPLADASVDVVHARFTYFFPPDCDAGLAEVMRVLRPGVRSSWWTTTSGMVSSRICWPRAPGLPHWAERTPRTPGGRPGQRVVSR
ncbi:MAG: class I SAM-dependent methyltransferase [Geodermatophilaceae bacterium]